MTYTTTTPVDPDGGAPLPDGGWASWRLAAAITATAALARLHRRRHYIPKPIHHWADEPAVEPPPLVVRTLHRTYRRRQQATRSRTPTTGINDDLAELAAALELADSEPDTIDGAVWAMTGPATPATARGLLIATLASGRPRQPSSRSHVVIPAATLAALTGHDPATLPASPRLHVVADIDAALTLLDEEILHRSRQGGDPDNGQTPRWLLLTHPPETAMAGRLAATAALAARHRIGTTIIGPCSPHPTVTVDPDGRVSAPSIVGRDRLDMLGAEDTVILYQILVEAHTGQPPQSPSVDAQRKLANNGGLTAAEHQANAKVERVADTDADAAPTDNNTGAAPPVSAVAVTVLGDPAIHGAHGLVSVDRAKSLELLAYLAVHADGATTDQIKEDILPDAPAKLRAGQRLHVIASTLRKALERAAASGDADAAPPDRNTYLARLPGGGYRLADCVNVDVWRFRRAMNTAATATDPSVKILAWQHAVDAYTGPLGGANPYEWIDGAREQVRRQAVDAHNHLGQALADTDPARSAGLLNTAARLDPHNTEIVAAAMHQHARVNDLDAVDALLEVHTRAMADIDLEPHASVLALSISLRRAQQ